jgi:glycine/D-amino acid oxidase-like deaminating enzyme
MPRNPDVVVVGAGIVGAACAWYLARSGQSVLVLERGFAGGSATAAGMGHIVVMDDSEAQFALTSWSARLLAEVQEELPREVECEWRGTLWVAEDDAQLEAARAKAGYYTARGVAAEVLDTSGLAAEEPALRGGLAGGLLVPGDGVVYPPALARWLLDGACRAGAELRQHVTVESVTSGAVTTSGDRIQCGAIINAAGAAAPRLTAGLPVVPRKGHLVITDRYPRLCRHQIVELGYLRSAHDDGIVRRVQRPAEGDRAAPHRLLARTGRLGPRRQHDDRRQDAAACHGLSSRARAAPRRADVDRRTARDARQAPAHRTLVPVARAVDRRRS